MQCYDSVDAIRKMLPKTYFQRKHAAQEIYAVLKHYKNLIPVMDEYVFNDGSTGNLMSLSGCIPILFEDNTYNIPVSLWLEESFPLTAPICYVKPTQEMVILRGGQVDSNGEIVLPYLKDWTQEYDLVTLLQVMSAMFGEIPPVFLRPHAGPEQASCSLQFHRQAEGLPQQDTDSYLFLTKDNSEPYQQENETNC